MVTAGIAPIRTVYHILRSNFFVPCSCFGRVKTRSDWLLIQCMRWRHNYFLQTLSYKMLPYRFDLFLGHTCHILIHSQIRQRCSFATCKLF